MESNLISNLTEEFIINPAIFQNISSDLDQPENKQLKFTLNKVDVSVANSLRRVILSEIPVFVLDSLDKEDINEENIKIYENTSILNNEIIKQRLSCIPVNITDFEEYEVNNYIVECNITNDTNEKMIVTTEDFKIKNKVSGEYLPNNIVKTIFKKDVLTNEYIDLVYLQPTFNENKGEKIHFECGFKISKAKENGSYNAVSTCVYSFTRDEERIQEAWKQIEDKLGDSREDREIAYNDFMNLDANRITIPNSFDFIIQSIGIYNNHDLVKLGCEIMIDKYKNFISYIETNDDAIKENLEQSEDSYLIKVENEDYTFGKVLENIIYINYFVEEKKMSYISMKKYHPHDTHCFILFSYINKTTRENIITDFKNISLMIIKIYENIKSNITKV